MAGLSGLLESQDLTLDEAGPVGLWLRASIIEKSELVLENTQDYLRANKEVVMKQEGKANGVKNVVLVHGGFVDGSGWQVCTASSRSAATA